jgi:uncharacterized protein (UPF0332 family)
MDERRKRIQDLFDGADTLYIKALDELDKNNLKNACGRGWGAVLLATSALLLAKTGEEPLEMSVVLERFSELGQSDTELQKTISYSYRGIEAFYKRCFHQEICGSRSDAEGNLQEIKEYVEDAKRLSGYTSQQ